MVTTKNLQLKRKEQFSNYELVYRNLKQRSRDSISYLTNKDNFKNFELLEKIKAYNGLYFEVEPKRK